MKTSPRTLFLLHQTLPLALCNRAGSVLMAYGKTQICLSDCQMVKRDSSLQRTLFHCSRVQCRQGLHHSSRLLALCVVILGLCVAAWPWKPILWISRQTVIVLTLLPEAVWNSVLSVATENIYIFFYMLRASALGGTVLWACVAYHFAAEPLLLLEVSISQ